jgi:serine/threonine-protein kinase RsbW
LGTEGDLIRRDALIGLKLRNRPSATGELRAAIDRVADECRLADTDRFDLKLAATEAVTNALRDAPEDDVVDVTLACGEAAVDIEVGPRRSASPVRGAGAWGPDAEGGRGIPIMIALVDEVEFKRTGAGTRVRIRKLVGAESAAA